MTSPKNVCKMLDIEIYCSGSNRARSRVEICVWVTYYSILFLPVIGYFISFVFISFFYSLSVYVNYVNYYFVIFMSHLHLNDLSLICDMWIKLLTSEDQTGATRSLRSWRDA